MKKFETLVTGDKVWYGPISSRDVHERYLAEITKIEKKTDSGISIFFKRCDSVSGLVDSIFVHTCDYYKITAQNYIFTIYENAKKLLPLWSVSFQSGQEDVSYRIKQILGIEEICSY